MNELNVKINILGDISGISKSIKEMNKSYKGSLRDEVKP